MRFFDPPKKQKLDCLVCGADLKGAQTKSCSKKECKKETQRRSRKVRYFVDVEKENKYKRQWRATVARRAGQPNPVMRQRKKIITDQSCKTRIDYYNDVIDGWLKDCA